MGFFNFFRFLQKLVGITVQVEPRGEGGLRPGSHFQRLCSFPSIESHMLKIRQVLLLLISLSVPQLKVDIHPQLSPLLGLALAWISPCLRTGPLVAVLQTTC